MISPTLNRAQKGATLVEYGVMVGFVSAIAIGALFAMGTSTSDSFELANSTLATQREAANGTPTTPPPPTGTDTSPNPFSFDITYTYAGGAPIQSNTITVMGIDTPIPYAATLSAHITDPHVLINGQRRGLTGTVSNGDTVTLSGTVPAPFQDTQVFPGGSLTLGDQSADWTIMHCCM